MDSRGQSLPPSHHHQHHQQPPHHHHQPPQGMMFHHHHPPYAPPQPQQNHPQMMATPTNNNNNRFPFTTQQQVIVPTTTPTTPLSQSKDPLSSPFSGDGSIQSGFGSDHNPNSAKKKRGRPRKYSPDGGGNNIALGLAPTPLSPSVGGGSGGGHADSGGPGGSSEKKHRGRPPGSSKRQLDALGNCGVGFTPHVILVNAGEDIAQKIIAFSKQGPRTVCVLSANGSICNVGLRQPAHTGAVVNYEGRFEIISLSGSFLFSENTGGEVRTGGLSVSLAGSDGRVLGGSVAGMLIAASNVQIIVGSFIANGKKTKYMPSVPQSQVLSFSAPPLPAAESPPSQDVSSEGSEENGSNHIDRNMGSYGNSNHPVNNMQMFNPMGWHSSAKMLQN